MHKIRISTLGCIIAFVFYSLIAYDNKGIHSVQAEFYTVGYDIQPTLIEQSIYRISYLLLDTKFKISNCNIAGFRVAYDIQQTLIQ